MSQNTSCELYTAYIKSCAARRKYLYTAKLPREQKQLKIYNRLSLTRTPSRPATAVRFKVVSAFVKEISLLEGQRDLTAQNERVKQKNSPRYAQISTLLLFDANASICFVRNEPLHPSRLRVLLSSCLIITKQFNIIESLL